MVCTHMGLWRKTLVGRIGAQELLPVARLSNTVRMSRLLCITCLLRDACLLGVSRLCIYDILDWSQSLLYQGFVVVW